MLVENVEYWVNWKAFKLGTSIFIPCLNCRSARATIRRELEKYGITALLKVKIEDGIRGLRIWRL